MGKISVVFKWEMRKVFTSWRKAVTVFILPAVLMMIALSLFPALMNFMSTGTVGRKQIVAVDAPKSFVEFTKSDLYTLSYDYDFLSSDELSSSDRDDILADGSVLLEFNGDVFDSNVAAYYEGLASGDEDSRSRALIRISYDSGSYVVYGRVVRFWEEVIPSYNKFCFQYLGGRYRNIGFDRFALNDYNIVTSAVVNRGTANLSASRLLPGLTILLLYYCVYSLTCDMFAAERDKGFLRKLVMTPVSPAALFGGKILAVTAISFVSAVVTYLVIFVASWVNVNSDPTSLLPFGLILMPGELLTFLLLIPATSFVMCAICINIIFSLQKMQDILMNLQFPLILLLIEFFLQMGRNAPPWAAEFLIPIHGTICAIRDIFATDTRWYLLLITCIADIGTGIFLLRRALRKIGDKGYAG